MTSEKILCPNCGTANREDSFFCKSCGNAITNGNSKDNSNSKDNGNSNGTIYEKNLIQQMNEKINLLAILVGFFVAVVFLFLGSGIYGLLLSSSVIDFFTYLFLVIVTMVFFGSLAIGIAGCSNYDDAKSNSIAFLLIIVNVFGMLFGFGFSLTMGVIGSLLKFIPSSSPTSTPSSSYPEPSPYQTTTNSDPSGTIIFILQTIIFLFSIIAAGILGCYLGVYIKKNYFKD